MMQSRYSKGVVGLTLSLGLERYNQIGRRYQQAGL